MPATAKKPPPRTALFTVRMTAHEMKMLAAVAKRDGRTCSNWVRWVVLRAFEAAAQSRKAP